MTSPQTETVKTVNALLSGKDKILRVQRVAQMLGIQPATVSMWLRTGRINGRKVGTMWQIMATEVVRYLNEGLLPEDPERNFKTEGENANAE